MSAVEVRESLAEIGKSAAGYWYLVAGAIEVVVAFLLNAWQAVGGEMPAWLPDALLALGVVTVMLSPFAAYHRLRTTAEAAQRTLTGKHAAELKSVTAKLVKAEERLADRWISDNSFAWQEYPHGETPDLFNVVRVSVRCARRLQPTRVRVYVHPAVARARAFRESSEFEDTEVQAVTREGGSVVELTDNRAWEKGEVFSIWLDSDTEWAKVLDIRRYKMGESALR